MKKTKVYINLILLAVVMLSSFSTALISASFKFNQPYIVARLCENRAKPEMKCNGKCYLKKQFEQENDHSNENRRTIMNKHTLNWTSQPVASSAFFLPESADMTYDMQFDLLEGFVNVVYHPPC